MLVGFKVSHSPDDNWWSTYTLSVYFTPGTLKVRRIPFDVFTFLPTDKSVIPRTSASLLACFAAEFALVIWSVVGFVRVTDTMLLLELYADTSETLLSHCFASSANAVWLFGDGNANTVVPIESTSNIASILATTFFICINLLSSKV